MSDFLDDVMRGLRPGRPPAPVIPDMAVSEVGEEHIEWLWPGRLPFGSLVVLDGDPGLGKSTLTADIAARVTTGRPFPGESPGTSRPCYTALILTAEDSVSAVLKPRLRGAEADLTRVRVASEVIDGQRGGGILIPDHLPLLESILMRENAALLVIDPLVAYLSPRVSYISDQSIRGALKQLADVAERTGACVLMVRHPAKGGGRAIHRGGGSVGITGSARILLYLAEHPLDQERRVLAVAKSNMATAPRSLMFRLTPTEAVARVTWDARTTHLTADHLAGFESEKFSEKEALREAAVVVERAIGPAGASGRDVQAAARAAQVTQAHTRGAKRLLGVRSEPSRFDDGETLTMPDR